MLHRPLRFPMVFLAFFLFLMLLIASGDGSLTSIALPQAAPVKHGLTGNYYVGSGGWTKDTTPNIVGYYQIWSDPNDFMLPRTFTAPATTRVDAQVAFGQGKGFNARPDGPPTIWWPTGFPLPAGWPNPNQKPWDQLAAVVWKGYIHLPKAGMYYFGTISNGASAVYLNQARVALNGGYGSALVSDAFAYAKEDVQDYVKLSPAYTFNPRPRDAYVVPVSIDAARDLPIEVHYNPTWKFTHWANEPLGADLFWVTPDSPRNDKGKPIASIVPSNALYTEPPNPIEKSVVRSANSTISADFLYFYFPSEKFVTVTIRLADKDGNPVAGRRVYVNSLNEWNPDAIVQPDKPTDKNGETTARIRENATNPYPHDSTIVATDVTDFVDVAQVAHVSFLPYVNSFFPQSYSPYYDPHGFTVEPLPMRVGQPLTIRVALENSTKQPGEVTATFKRNDWNIGAAAWIEVIGEVKNIRLNPHEHKDISITWTPKKASEHQCFRVELNGHLMAAGLASPNPVAAIVPALIWQASGSQNVPFSDSKSQNFGPVEPPSQPDECNSYYKGEYGDLPTIQGHKWAQQNVDSFRKSVDELMKALDRGGLSPEDRRTLDGKLTKAYGAWMCVNFWAGEAGRQKEKNDAQQELPPLRAFRDNFYSEWWGCIRRLKHCSANHIVWLTNVIRMFDDQITQDVKLAADPPDANYRRLAPAAAETPPALLDALRRSLERYQGARAEGDAVWMSRHLTAMRLYEQRIADSLRRGAAELEQNAQSFPAEEPQDVEKLQADLTRNLETLRRGGPIPPDLRQQLLSSGIAEADLKRLETPQPAFQVPSDLKPLKDTFLNFATLQKTFADQWQEHSETGADQETSSQQNNRLLQSYNVGNPHDKEETVDLFIRPVSIPADWKLSIVNAEQTEAQGQKAPGDNPPKYPVREADPGKHYAVTLPAKAQVRVASVLIPVGEVGARTTARWAVEGKIGDELIGGMVHEMNVPYIIADLKLPPLGSKEEEEELPAPGRPWARLVAEVAAAIIILGLLVYFFILRRRRHQTGPSALP
jgi:hypothetical protein